MKLISILIFGIFILSNNTKIIYGDDSYVEVAAAIDGDINWYKTSKSVAVIIPRELLIEVTNGSYKIKHFTLHDEIEHLTKEHRFATQPANAIGTAFLVGENKMVTAGHLIKDLRKSVIIFDYEWNCSENRLHKEIYESSEIYRMQKVILRCNTKRGDYALFEIDNSIKDRTPLTLSEYKQRGKISVKMISSPDGTPLKLTSEGNIWDKNPTLEGLSEKGFFIHNLDNSGGSSGAPIFDSITGEVIGIQSGGDENFVNINEVIHPVKGDKNGKNTNIDRDLSGEYGSKIPRKLIYKLNQLSNNK